MTQDKAFTLTIDKGNNLDQNLVKNAADMLRLQLSEKSTPSADKYAFKRFVTMGRHDRGERKADPCGHHQQDRGRFAGAR